MRYALLCATLASLTNCTQVATTALEDARLLHDNGRRFVMENHEKRREIRRRCWELTVKEAEQLAESGDFAGARAVLEAAYPQIVTATAVKELMDNPAEFSAGSSGC